MREQDHPLVPDPFVESYRSLGGFGGEIRRFVTYAYSHIRPPFGSPVRILPSPPRRALTRSKTIRESRLRVLDTKILAQPKHDTSPALTANRTSQEGMRTIWRCQARPRGRWLTGIPKRRHPVVALTLMLVLVGIEALPIPGTAEPHARSFWKGIVDNGYAV